MNPDTRCPFLLTTVLSWPKLETVSSPTIRARIAELQGGCRLETNDKIRNTKAEWEKAKP